MDSVTTVQLFSPFYVAGDKQIAPMSLLTRLHLNPREITVKYNALDENLDAVQGI